MKNLLKKLSVFCAIILATSFVFNLSAFHDVSAECRNFLGMTSWDCNTGFTDATGKIEKLDEAKLKTGIWQIVANIATDITVAAGWLAIGFVIYGGYRYMFSGGDPGKVASGKKTLTQAFIGLAIAISAYVIMNTIRIALISGGNIGNCDLTSISNTNNAGCTNISDASSIINSLITYVTGIAGIISVIFIVYGGASYITSAGDPSKVEKAKKAILYSLIGLILVALSIIIINFVGETTRKAGGTDAAFKINNTTTIAKEVHETHTT